MSKPWRQSILLFAVTAVLLTLAPNDSAWAGDYSVRQCEGARQQDFFGYYGELSPDRVDAVSGCSNSQVGRLGVYQDRSGREIPAGAGGQFLWVAPTGVEIFGTMFKSRLNDVNGMRAALVGFGGQFADVSVDEGLVHDGQPRTTRWTNPSRPRAVIAARLSCRWVAGCPNVAGGKKAYLEVTDAEFKARDVSPPALSGSGSLKALGTTWQWHSGDVGFTIQASDVGSGVARIFLKVNGLPLDLDEIPCPGAKEGYATSFSPCPFKATRSGNAKTTRAPFQEGTNAVQFCVEDYAASPAEANQSCEAAQLVFIDNVDPSAPAGLTVTGGSDWRSENGFELTWTNPEDQRAPIFGANFRVTRAGSGELVQSGTVPTPTKPAIGPLNLPGPGEYQVEVRLQDGAGNLGQPASTRLRFDDARPSDVAPEAPAGWISADELPLRQPIEKADPGGPSGVSGYAVEVTRDAPVSPCPGGQCLPDELNVATDAPEPVATIQGLSEGDHWISAVAASGARLSSENAGSTLVRVDKTAPEVNLSGVPSGWVNHPVTLTANASDAGSGMAAQPGLDDGQPVTAIRVGDNAPYVAPGNTASFTVAEGGSSRVAFWARDLAGNIDDGALLSNGDFHPRPGEALVKIDRRSPMVALEEKRDPDDPERLEAIAADSDSGLDSGTISYRRKGSTDGFHDLATMLEGDRLVARLQSDELPAGPYEIRAEVRDRAGNTGRSTDTDGSMTLELPLKTETSVQLNFMNGEGRSRTVRPSPGKPTRVMGRLTRRDGSPITGSAIVFEQSYAAGSRRSTGSTVGRTDGTGSFVFKIKPGPTRSVRVSFGGNRIERPSQSPDLKVVFRDRVRFRARPKIVKNGGRTLMTGRVQGPGALPPARGKLVAIQYFDPARSKWRPVAVLRANRQGRFRYPYRFRTIAFAQRIRFRAISLPESGWPFKPSTSGSRSVIVYPKR